MIYSSSLPKPIDSIENKNLRNEISSIIKQKHSTIDIKTPGANNVRGGFHTRFPLQGKLLDFNNIFSKSGIIVQETDYRASGKYDTFLFTKTIGKKMAYVFWVNNAIGVGSSVKEVFISKDLSPDKLNLAGKTLSASEIISTTIISLEKNFPEEAPFLINLMKSVSQSSLERIPLNPPVQFEAKDLTTISKDFGEVLSALWIIKNKKFDKVKFPLLSNEPLVDFYGVRMGVEYPFSVKSGSTGGKVTFQNIIDKLALREKTSKFSLEGKAAHKLFTLHKTNTAKEGIVAINKLVKTPGIKKLSTIMKVPVDNISITNITSWLNKHSNEELRSILKPFHDEVNSYITEDMWKRQDKVRFVVSPLGETLWKFLNNDKEIKSSLTEIGKQIVLTQINIDVRKTNVTVNLNKFKDNEFKFSWAGYSSGNKLGFSLELKK